MASVYNFDPTGTSSTNRINNEQHVITAVNFRDYHYIIPKFAPFFQGNFQIRVQFPDQSVRTLVEGKDYYLSNQFLDASRACAKPLYGSISFLDTSLYGIMSISYNTVGGIWNITAQEITRILAEEMRNPRTTTWEQVTNLPQRFPVVDHEWDLVDMVGAKKLVESIDSVRDAVLASNGGGLTSHLGDMNNPHAVTKTQVGLGNVLNYGIATAAQARDGVLNTAYMTPLRTADAIAQQAGALVTAHEGRKDNPHAVTKLQVGLGSVENFPTASQAEAEAGVAPDRFMTPQRTKQLVAGMENTLAVHAANKLNPHDVTKDQVGLFNVENYRIATEQEARAGLVNTAYMTPLRSMQLIREYVALELDGHAMRIDNPHAVTKGQVGLPLVQNYAVATVSEMTAGTANDKYVTPALVSVALANFSNNVSDHVGNNDNPHGVSKDQVGLGNVSNFALATSAEMTTGTANNKYVTPELVKVAMTSFNSDVFAHIEANNNPHNVTKTQVGLPLVENYAVATDAEMAAGLVTNKYVTPALVKVAMTSFNTSVTAHVAARDNPHAVTKLQVGLGNVANYGIATEAEMTVGTVNDKYVTPALVSVAMAGFNADVTAHVAARNNPHGVTKTQVGLGNVSNFSLATEAEMAVGTAIDKYVTPALVKSALASFNTDTAAHVAARNNPHGVTKDQVGLGNVLNYGFATDVEMAAGTATNKYVNPALVKSAMASFSAGMSLHVEDENNPHAVTKAQVGLSSVENYPIASQSEAEAGVSNIVYMTPLRTLQLCEEFVSEQLDGHALLTNNPHSVTKAQIGLGSVENFGIATASEMTVGTATNKYVTPELVSSAITRFNTSVIAPHISNKLNPHGVTASQVGAYSIEESDLLFSRYLEETATAADSEKLGGRTSEQLRDWMATSMTGINATTLSGLTVQQVTAQAAQGLGDKFVPRSSYTTVEEGAAPVMAGMRWTLVSSVGLYLQAGQSPAAGEVVPDAVLLVTGGRPQAGSADFVADPLVIKTAASAGAGQLKLEVRRLFGELQTPPVTIGYVWSPETQVLKVYARTPSATADIQVVSLTGANALTADADKAVTRAEPAGIIYVAPVNTVAGAVHEALQVRVKAIEDLLDSITVE